MEGGRFPRSNLQRTAERPPAESLNVRILQQRPALQAWNLTYRGGAHDPRCKTMTDYPLPSCRPPFKYFNAYAQVVWSFEPIQRGHSAERHRVKGFPPGTLFRAVSALPYWHFRFRSDRSPDLPRPQSDQRLVGLLLNVPLRPSLRLAHLRRLRLAQMKR